MQALPKSAKDMAMGILSSEKTRFRTHRLPFSTAPAHNYLTAKGFFLQAGGSQMRQERGDTHTHFGNVQIHFGLSQVLCVCACVCVCACYWFLVGRGGDGGREDGERDGEEEEEGNCSQKREEREHKMRQEKREETGEERHQASHRCWIQPT